MSLKSSVNALLSRSEITVGTVASELGNLNAMGVIGSRGVRGQADALNCQMQGGCDYCNGQQGHTSIQHSLICRHLLLLAT